MILKHSLCLAWNWKYDADFIGILEQSLHERGLSFLQVTLENVNAFIDEYLSEPAPFRVFWNRTYGSELEFKPLVHWAGANDVYCINSHDKTILACDKSIMHYILINAGIYTPHTIILPSYQDQPVLSPPDLKPLKSN